VPRSYFFTAYTATTGMTRLYHPAREPRVRDTGWRLTRTNMQAWFEVYGNHSNRASVW
jgi:hypothetical protein